MDWIYLIGRVLFSLIFLLSGVSHFTQLDAMSKYAASSGVPAPKLSVAVSGLMVLAGGLSVLLGLYMEIGAWLIVLFLLPVAFMMHAFWKVGDPMQRATQQAHFMKNVALAGAAMILYWAVQMQGYGPFTLGEPLS